MIFGCFLVTRRVRRVSDAQDQECTRVHRTKQSEFPQAVPRAGINRRAKKCQGDLCLETVSQQGQGSKRTRRGQAQFQALVILGQVLETRLPVPLISGSAGHQPKRCRRKQIIYPNSSHLGSCNGIMLFGEEGGVTNLKINRKRKRILHIARKGSNSIRPTHQLIEF